MALLKPHLVLLLAAAALTPLLVTARLSANVTPSNASTNGTNGCQPLVPCDLPKPGSAEIESVFGLGLLSKASSNTATYQYEGVTPAAAVDWRTVLTNWAVRDQGTCGQCHVSACWSLALTYDEAIKAAVLDAWHFVRNINHASLELVTRLAHLQDALALLSLTI